MSEHRDTQPDNGEYSPEIIDLQQAFEKLLRASSGAFAMAKNLACANLDQEGRPTVMVARYKVGETIYMPVVKRVPNSGGRLVAEGGGALVLHELSSDETGKTIVCEIYMELPDQYMVSYCTLWTDGEGFLKTGLTPNELVKTEHSLGDGIIGMTMAQYDEEVDVIRKNQVAAVLQGHPDVGERIFGAGPAERMRQIAEVMSGLSRDYEIPGDTLDAGGLYNFE